MDSFVCSLSDILVLFSGWQKLFAHKVFAGKVPDFVVGQLWRMVRLIFIYESSPFDAGFPFSSRQRRHAVAQVGKLPYRRLAPKAFGAGSRRMVQNIAPADYQSGIRQTTSLRYVCSGFINRSLSS